MVSEKKFEIHWIIKGMTTINAENKGQAYAKFEIISGDDLLDDADPLEIEFFSEVD